ncbi:phosphocholine cytidylyltransferase family protein [Helicobacter cholecystus]|uniref:Phosphocholine cytidylyltransferase family protein n=1 Tax=Helicobacter cholecystus TaxID=45498 RepID=A0A3D8ITN2_9HELI|nr:phosphocholine cytidylyltransferase family protein [Helicobacter cholecystus]RDU68638.1 phosphocholine cytidylyltransferase family protein [Helicobacter cholecystus]VEJ24430.1 sugar nucleotidyltransferase [Helicobacter cholecystus]
MNALILAAGFGSRLMPLTQNKPKCMVECNGKKIIDYEIESLKEAGIKKIAVVGGYLFDVLASHLANQNIVDIYYNEKYVTTNMVSTFFCALDFLHSCIKEGQDLIISYADIIYHPNIVKKLSQAQGEFCVVVDLDWQRLWEKRFENPLNDAETLKVVDGKIIELGKKPKSIKEVEGQYIGLFKFSHTFLKRVIKEYEAMNREAIYDGCNFEKMYMTSFLQHLIYRFNNAQPVFIYGEWGEIDCVKDLEIMENEKIIC